MCWGWWRRYRGACAGDGGGGIGEHVLGMVEEVQGSMCWGWWRRYRGACAGDGGGGTGEHVLGMVEEV